MGQAFSDPCGTPPVVTSRRRTITANEVNGHEGNFIGNIGVGSRSQSPWETVLDPNFPSDYSVPETFYEPSLSPSCLTQRDILAQVNGVSSEEMLPHCNLKPYQDKHHLDLGTPYDSSSFDNQCDVDHLQSLTVYDQLHSRPRPIICEINDESIGFQTSPIRNRQVVCNTVDSLVSDTCLQQSLVPHAEETFQIDCGNIDDSVMLLNKIVTLKSDSVTTSNSDLSSDCNVELKKKKKRKRNNKAKMQEVCEVNSELSNVGEKSNAIPSRTIDALNVKNACTVMPLNSVENVCVEPCQSELNFAERESDSVLRSCESYSDKGPLNNINIWKLRQEESLCVSSALSSQHIKSGDEILLNNGAVWEPAPELLVKRLNVQRCESSSETLEVPVDESSEIFKKIDQSCNVRSGKVSSSTIATANDKFPSTSSACDEYLLTSDTYPKAISEPSDNLNNLKECASCSNECLENLAPKLPTMQTMISSVCFNSTDVTRSKTPDNAFSNSTSKTHEDRQRKKYEALKPCVFSDKNEVLRNYKLDTHVVLNEISPKITEANKSVSISDERIQDSSEKFAEILGSFQACVVKCFPKSRVVTFDLNGKTTRAFFFLSDVENSEVPPVDSIVTIKNLTRVPESQPSKIYGSTIRACHVTVPEEHREEVNGRTGAIVSFIDSETGVLELTMGTEKLFGSFSKRQVSGVNFNGQTLEKTWPVGTTVHFCGKLVMKLNRKDFLVSKVWPQGGQNVKSDLKNSTSCANLQNISIKHSSSANVEKASKPITTTTGPQTESKEREKSSKKETILALSGKVKEYLSNGNGIVKFRLGQLLLESEFNVNLCTDLVPGKTLPKQWPPSTQVHFHGELTTYQNHSKFEITRIWSKRRLIKANSSEQGVVFEGEVTELRVPSAFVVSVVISKKLVKVYVMSYYFRKSSKEPQLKEKVPVHSIVHIGQRISLRIKESAPGKDCPFVGTDAWPSEVVNCTPNPKVANKSVGNIVLLDYLGHKTCTPRTPNPLSIPLFQPMEISRHQNSVEYCGTLPCIEQKSIVKTSTVSKQPTSDTSNTQSDKATPSSVTEPGGAGAPGSCPSKVGQGRCGRVVRVTPGVALVRVQKPPRTGADDACMVAALAANVHLCGVPLADIDLTVVLTAGQELEVHLLPIDEKRLSKFDASSPAAATPSLRNTALVSEMWVGGAHFESSSLQFAELTKYCQDHKVPGSVRHTLTLRLGQLLGEDGQKGIKHSSEEELDATERGYKNKSENVKLTSHLAVTPDEAMILSELKDMGPEKFLRAQLKKLMLSVLKESVRSAQEFFLSSLKENCGGTELYNSLATQAPTIVDAALREFLHGELLQEGIVVGGPVCHPTSNVPAFGASNVSASAESTAVAVARFVSSSTSAATVAADSATVPPTIQLLPKAVASGRQSSAASATASPCLTHAAPSVTGKDAIDGVLGDEDVEVHSQQRQAAGRLDATCLLLRGVQEVLQQAKKGLKATPDVPCCAMQEPVKKHSKIEVADQLAGVSAVSDVTVIDQKREGSEVTPALDVPDTGEPDKRDFQKTLCAELQKHAKELAIFRDEACSLIENWKSQDSPPATPEELDFLQELSLLLDNKVEENGKGGKNEEDTSLVAQQLIKFWNAANFSLTPAAQRGLQRLQELFGSPNKKMQGNEKECLGSGGDGLVEVEAALKEVREAFRDVKHVFEVQRCFRDLRECFRDVRRAYKGREPRPRALPPCADAPACAAAAAAAAAHALADAVQVSVPVQAKKRGRGAAGSRTPSPTHPAPPAPPRKKLPPAPAAPQQRQEKSQDAAPSPKTPTQDNAAAREGEGGGAGAAADTMKATTTPEAPVSKDCPSAQSHENTKVEVSSKSSQTNASIDTAFSPSSTTTSEQAAQTISTGAVLALHLLPDE